MLKSAYGVGKNRIVQTRAKSALTHDIDFAPKDVGQAQFDTGEIVQAHARCRIELDENVDIRSRHCVTSCNAAEDRRLTHARSP